MSNEITDQEFDRMRELITKARNTGKLTKEESKELHALVTKIEPNHPSYLGINNLPAELTNPAAHKPELIVHLDPESWIFASRGRKLYLGGYGKLILNPSKSKGVFTKKALGVIIRVLPHNRALARML